MRNKVVVLPFDGVALLHLNGHRIKLKIPHGNLRDSRCEGRRNGSTMVGIIVGQGLLLAVPAVVLGWLGQAIAVVGGLRVTRPIDPAQLADYGDGPAPRVQ